MNARMRKFTVVAFLFLAPLFGFSCASTKKSPEKPAPAPAVQATADTQNQGEAAPAAPAVVPKKKNFAARMVCELNKDRRTVVYRMKGTGCVVTYTKFGQSKVAVESPDGTDRCDNVFDRYKHNLTASGFDCQETD